MGANDESRVRIERRVIPSLKLSRDVVVDLYLPSSLPQRPIGLLLINDGQDLAVMNFKRILDRLYVKELIRPLICVGIHCGPDRRMEYGTAGEPDHMGRGAKADAYVHFVFRELIPFLRERYGQPDFSDKSFAGFSLGGLSALDIAWSHPGEFVHAAVFSGSLWWRSKALDDGYDEQMDRIMHKRVRNGPYSPGLRFFFQAGMLDETMDRNGNGIIDSIDDTMGLIDELSNKGYNRFKDIRYLEFPDGRHDVETWGRAIPEFLTWAFGKVD